MGRLGGSPVTTQQGTDGRLWATAKVELDEALTRVCKASAALSNSQPASGQPGAAEWYECNRPSTSTQASGTSSSAAPRTVRASPAPGSSRPS